MKGRCCLLNNYNYFIVLAEEMNISHAAGRLFISHQCLSKYLKNLEKEYNVTFFERSPKLSLTPAGQAYLATLRQIQFLENNLNSQLDDIRQSKKGVIRFGTTEGRYRVLVPALLSDYKRIYPDVKLQAEYDTSDRLCEQILNNELDIALMNKRDINQNQFEMQTILDENLYMVISDHMLAQYFPSEYPACKETFGSGVDLAKFDNRQVPFVLNYRGFNSREILEDYLNRRNLQLNCVLELSPQDMHFMLAARDYAACFCWAMYVPTIQHSYASSSPCHLNIFPIKGLSNSNQVVLVRSKGKILPAYGRDLIRLIKQNCTAFSA